VLAERWCLLCLLLWLLLLLFLLLPANPDNNPPPPPLLPSPGGVSIAKGACIAGDERLAWLQVVDLQQASPWQTCIRKRPVWFEQSKHCVVGGWYSMAPWGSVLAGGCAGAAMRRCACHMQLPNTWQA
jgi:hypothetical protein